MWRGGGIKNTRYIGVGNLEGGLFCSLLLLYLVRRIPSWLVAVPSIVSSGMEAVECCERPLSDFLAGTTAAWWWRVWVRGGGGPTVEKPNESMSFNKSVVSFFLSRLLSRFDVLLIPWVNMVRKAFCLVGYCSAAMFCFGKHAEF